MKKNIFILFFSITLGLGLFGQENTTTRCNLSVYIDSIVVRPCFFTGPGGGTCGCGNTLWAVPSGGTPPYSYVWTPSGATTDTLRGACYMLFKVVVTDARGCTDSASLNVIIPPPPASGVAELYNKSGINLFPVPAGNLLNISFNDADFDLRLVELYDMYGRKIADHKISVNAMQHTLDISGLPNGNYLLRALGNGGQRTTRFSVEK